MAGPLTQYAFINAKVRARISKLLSDEILRQMVKAHSLDEALGFLRDTHFSVLDQTYSDTGDLKRAELELLKEEINIYRTIAKYVRGKTLNFVQALLLRYEIDNLKNAIRVFFDRKIRKRAIDTAAYYLLYETIVREIALDAIVNAENLGQIVDILAPTPYGTIIEKHREDVELNGSLFFLEVGLDHYFYKNLIIQAEQLSRIDRKEALRLIGVEIDLQNINWIIRFKNFYKLPLDQVLMLIIPSGFNLDSQVVKEAYTAQNVNSILQNIIKTSYPGLSTFLSSQVSDSSSRLLLIERILEQIMKHEIQRILTGYPFTIGIILSYFILKGNEIKRVKTVLNAKQYAISEERIEGLI